jgi:hypothetical protein
MHFATKKIHSKKRKQTLPIKTILYNDVTFHGNNNKNDGPIRETIVN